MLPIKLLLTIVSYFSYATSHTLPSYIKKCNSKSDAETLNKCFLDSVNFILPILGKGIPELGADPVDPLKLGNFTVGEGSGIVHVVQKYINSEMKGISKTKAENVRVLLTDKQFNIELHTFAPHLITKGGYNLNGRLLVFPVFGTGYEEIHLYDVKLTLILNGVSFDKKGETYFKFKECKLSIVPKRLTYDFQNLFNGNKALGDNINKILNENDVAVFADVKKGYEETISVMIKNIVNNIVTKIPIKDLLDS